MTATKLGIQESCNQPSYGSDCYEWMAGFLEPGSTVLEIGCGSGEGTLKIAQKALQVVAIDIDSVQTRNAVAYLNSNDIPSKVIELQELGAHLADPQFKVLFISADIFDIDLVSRVAGIKFDVICSWLMGGTRELVAMHLGRKIESIMRADVRKYTDSVHQKIYELASRVLSQSGIIHFVDSKALESMNDDAYARQSIAAQHQYLTRDRFRIRKEMVVIKKVSDFRGVHLSLCSSRITDEATIIPVLSSIKAFAR